jgi:hypothetical protein
MTSTTEGTAFTGQPFGSRVRNAERQPTYAQPDGSTPTKIPMVRAGPTSTTAASAHSD